MVASLICEIETKIRNLSVSKGVRTSEFFLDFDKFRTGFISATQFFRVLNRNFGLKFTPEEEEILIERYECGRKCMVNYKAFCENIDKTYDPKNFSVDPSCQTVWQCYSKPENKCWTPNLDGELNMLLQKLHAYYSYRGLSLRSLCKDFDPCNEGIINETQFYRTFITPADFTGEDIVLIVQKYEDPNHRNMVRYMDLLDDMKKFDDCKNEKQDELRNITCCETEKPDCQDLQSLLTRLCETAYKYQIRSIDFFKDYDPLRTGCISITQFLAGLDLSLGKVIRLTEEEKAKLFQTYLQLDGRVCYKDFCNLLDDAFLETNLEKKPLKDVEVVLPGTFSRRLNILSEDEEEKLKSLLERITKQMNISRAHLSYFFRSFDTGCNSRQVTKSQFHRVLSLCNIDVHPEEFTLLCKKFTFSNPNYINYPAFVEIVDIAVQMEKQRSCRTMAARECKSKEENVCYDEVNVGCLITRLRHHLIVNRIRAKDFFQDFDTLRSGRVTKDQFKRSLIAMGCGSIHSGLNFSAAQLDALANAYSCPQDCLNVYWTKFVDHLEAGYSDKNLEKRPCHKLRPMSDFICSRPGTLSVDTSSEEHKDRFKSVMCKIGSKVRHQNIDLLQIFRNFDKMRHGHVSRTKFRQALGVADINCCDELDMMAVEAAFYDEEGINYITLLEHIANSDVRRDINEINKEAYFKRIQENQMNSEQLNCCSQNKDLSNDLQELLLRIKSKLFKENLRVVDWFKDHDKLNTGHISRSNFRRSLDLCRFGIQEYEVYLLEDFLKSSCDPNRINYLKFSAELESIFACPHLEKTPTREVEMFQLPDRLASNVLTTEEVELLKCCLRKILAKYKILRPSFFPFLRDFDKVNTGSVSKSQFRRSLGELGLASEINSEAAWNILFKKFAIKLGGRDDIDYLSFFCWLEKYSRLPSDPSSSQ